MKNENLLLNSNILEINISSKFLNSNKTLGDTIMNIVKEYKDKGRIVIEDNEQRMFMDGLKNMLEAMLAGQHDVAECYSRMHKDLTESFETYRNMSFKELLQNRLYQNGYSPDDELDEKLQDLLDSL
jgi:hypothetical protein